MQLLLTLTLNIATVLVSAKASLTTDTKDDDWGRFDDELEAAEEDIYGLQPQEYQQYVVPEQYIIGLNGANVSNATTYVQDILQKGNFVNATALWHYQTTTLTGVTIAGMDNYLYHVFQDDPNVVFIEPVSNIGRSQTHIRCAVRNNTHTHFHHSGCSRHTGYHYKRKLAIKSAELGSRPH